MEWGWYPRCADRAGPRMFCGPMPIHEVGTLLLALGEDPSSVDGYNKKHGLAAPLEGVTHHPMYDAAAAAIVWEHAMARLQSR